MKYLNADFSKLTLFEKVGRGWARIFPYISPSSRLEDATGTPHKFQGHLLLFIVMPSLFEFTSNRFFCFYICLVSLIKTDSIVRKLSLDTYFKKRYTQFFYSHRLTFIKFYLGFFLRFFLDLKYPSFSCPLSFSCNFRTLSDLSNTTIYFEARIVYHH